VPIAEEVPERTPLPSRESRKGPSGIRHVLALRHLPVARVARGLHLGVLVCYVDAGQFVC
jgi:hypothetical protein